MSGTGITISGFKWLQSLLVCYKTLSFLLSVVGMELYFVSGIVGCSEFAFGQPITSIEVFLQVINLFWVSKFEGFRVPATDISYCEGWLFSGCKFHIQKPTNGCLFMYILFV